MCACRRRRICAIRPNRAHMLRIQSHTISNAHLYIRIDAPQTTYTEHGDGMERSHQVRQFTFGPGWQFRITSVLWRCRRDGIGEVRTSVHSFGGLTVLTKHPARQKPRTFSHLLRRRRLDPILVPSIRLSALDYARIRIDTAQPEMANFRAGERRA